MKIILFVAGVLLCLFVGGVMVTYILGGLITFLGIVFLIESIPWLKWVSIRLKNLIDILLFGFAIYGAVTMSVTMAMSFAVAGLGYTMVYKPYLVESKDRPKERAAGSAYGKNVRRKSKYKSLN